MQMPPARDYFTDPSILQDPYQYFEALREKGPVHQLPGRDIFVVTGFDESLEVLNNTADFSSLVAAGGLTAPLPFTQAGDDLTAQIEAHRHEVPGADLLAARDGTAHGNARVLLAGLFTPSRLKTSADYMTGLAETLVTAAVARGRCDLIKEIAAPFAMLGIAGLLGVPAAGREHFVAAIAAGGPLEVIAGFFETYLAARRHSPRGDVLSELATAGFPDGTIPDLAELVRLATYLFGAGQDTTAKLLGNAMRLIIEQPGLQAQLRAAPALLPAFLEEALRLEGVFKLTARLARKASVLGGVAIPIGAKIMVALAAANRDPRRWDYPRNFALNRPSIEAHLAFGHGAHACIGAPLARAAARIMLAKLLEQTAHIDLDTAVHGKRRYRHFVYDPSFFMRGLETMQLILQPH